MRDPIGGATPSWSVPSRLDRLSPGEAGEALVGFPRMRHPNTKMTLEAVDQSFVYRLDATAGTLVDLLLAAPQDRSPFRLDSAVDALRTAHHVVMLDPNEFCVA